MDRIRAAGSSRLTAGVAGAALMGLAVSVVGGYEGVRYKAYLPTPNDVPTICFGETRGVRMGDTATPAQCRDMLGQGLKDFAAAIEVCMVSPQTIPAKTYVASLSLAYNIGQTAFCRSTVLRNLNAGKWRDACDAFRAWNKQAGRVLQGLVNRREDERRLCLEGLQ
ncbi:lysozyme [Aureimonas endophytica]|uniref:Lysozyme n=2 Tax=Aureimonas endophytica TaxID=2027858 RepID=A0A917E9U0_9HYPH|nr:lysozyme [Aureimonas endophytica]